jgi:hypothetical protein
VSDVIKNLEGFFKPRESKRPRFGDFNQETNLAAMDALTEEQRMKANPHDPHHVILDLVKDLHSTNLSRQKEIMVLREQCRQLMSDSQEAKVLRTRIAQVLPRMKEMVGSSKTTKSKIYEFMLEASEILDP